MRRNFDTFYDEWNLCESSGETFLKESDHFLHFYVKLSKKWSHEVGRKQPHLFFRRGRLKRERKKTATDQAILSESPTVNSLPPAFPPP